MLSPDFQQHLSTERNRSESPLLRLPAELRNQIFEYALHEHTGRTFQVDKRNIHEGRFLKKPAFNALDLLQVSRQVYAETAALPVRRNTYFFVQQPNDTRFFNGLSTVHKAAITSVKLEFVRYDLEKLWLWDIDVWSGFNSPEFAFLESLPGLRIVHVNVVTIWDYPLSLEDELRAEEIVTELQHDLRANLGEGIDVQMHYLSSAERDVEL
jgi:hypothetical protein